MERLFARRARERGERWARRWYRRQVLAFAARVPGETVRELRVGPGERMMGVMRQVIQAARGLGRSPGFSALAILTLSLGIGANALIFAVADRALLRPLPFPEPDRLVSVLDGWTHSPGTLEILARDMATVDEIGAAWDAVGMTWAPRTGAPRRVTAAEVSPSYLRLLGVAPRLGRLFRDDEARPGQGDVAVVGHDFWRTAFGADPGVLGRTITLDGREVEVVGVLPEGFDLPSARNDFWVPMTMNPANPGLHWGMGTFALVARMREEVTPEQVRAETVELGEEVRLANPLWTPAPDFWREARVVPLREARSTVARTPLLILLGAVGVVLLVVCANVANLLLSRGISRGRDRAVRMALGASGARLALGQFSEALVLCAAGTGLGLGMAALGLDLLRPLLPPEVPGAAQAGLDLRVVAVSGGLAVVTALLVGTLPAIRASRRAPAGLLRQGGRGQVGPRSRRGTTRVLVGAQMAAAVVLVTAAGLLARSLVQLNRVDPGFQASERVTARVDVPPGAEPATVARAVFFQGLLDRLSAEPGLARVALASSIPFGSERENMAAFVPGVTEDPNSLPVVGHYRVTPDFFEVAGISLEAGRPFAETDRLGEPLVAVVDRPFAERFFPGEDPVGRTVRYPWRGAPDMEIVGVVGGIGDLHLSQPPEPTVYVPLAQMQMGSLGHAMVVAQVPSGGESAGLAAIQIGVRDFDPRMPLSELAPWTSLLQASLSGTRLLTILLLVFAFTALVLGCVGVYGVASFSVRERIREIGVRMTLGADPGEIRGRVVREGLWMALPGCVAGLALAAIAARVLGSVLYGVSPLDPLTFLVTPAILVAAALLAVYLPARRATRVDPATVLREG
jgi:putative ABC transport system permease protein